MKEDTVSVIMPAYNAEKYIDRSIASVIQQTYEKVDLVIVDDKSTDNTLEIIHAAASIWPDRIKWAARKQNGGTAAALNDAIALAEGDYICWLSADDLYADNMVASEIAFLQQHPQLDAVFSKCAYINETDRYLGEVDLNKGFFKKYIEQGIPGITSLLLHMNFWHGCSLLAKAKCFKQGKRFDLSYKAAQDYDFWLRLAADYDIGYLDQVNVFSREHSGQASKHINCALDEIAVFFNTLHSEELIKKLLDKMQLDYTFDNIKPYILSRVQRYQNKDLELKTLIQKLEKYKKCIEDGQIHFVNR